MEIKFKEVIFIGNLGQEYVQIGKIKKNFPGGSALRFAVFSRPWFPAKMFAVAGQEQKWKPILKVLSKNQVDTNLIKFSNKEIVFFVKYNNNFQLQDFKIKNPENMSQLLDYSDKLIFKKNNILHVCPLNTDIQMKFVKLAEKNRIPVSLQLHFTSIKKEIKEEYFKMIKKVKILFLNNREAEILTGEKEPSLAGEKLAKICKGLIFITAAEKDVVVFKNGNKFISFKPFVARKIIDVTGAGDAFAAGTLGGLIQFGNIKNALVLGCMTANLNLNNPLKEFLEFLKENYDRK